MTIVTKFFHRHPKFYFWLFLILIVTLSVFRVFININESLTIDEPFSANAVTLEWAELLAIFNTEPSAPLYYFMLKFWVLYLGDSETALRSFSALCFATTIIFVSTMTMKIEGASAGVASAMLTASSSVGIIFAGTARPYALLSTIVAANTLILFHILNLLSQKTPYSVARNKFFPLAALITINVLGLLTHPIFLFYMTAWNCSALVASRQKFWIVTICNFFTLVVYLLLWGPYLFQTISLPATDWMVVPGFNQLIQGYFNIWGAKKTILILAFIVISTFSNFPSIKTFFQSRLGLVITSALMITSVLPFWISQYRPVYTEFRTPSLFFPIASVWAALLLTRLKHQWFTFATLTIVFSAAIIWPLYNSNSELMERSPRSSVQYVIENAACGDIIISGGLSNNEVAYYLRKLNAPTCVKHEVFPKSMMEHPGWMDPPSLLANTSELKSEVELLVRQAIENLNSSGRIWFFYEENSDRQKVLDILKKQLEAEMDLKQDINGYGSFFTSILVYVVR